MAGSYLRLPPGPIERSPVVVVEPFDGLLVRHFSTQEEQVLYEVTRGQRSLTTVEHLEDDLCVVIVLEVDDNQLEQVQQCIDDVVGPVRPVDRRRCRACCVSEKRTGLEVQVISGRPLISHRGRPDQTVAASGPELVLLVRLVDHVRRVLQEPPYLTNPGRVLLLQDIQHSPDKQLQRRQALLAIDDRSKSKTPGWRWQLLADDGPEEVRGHRLLGAGKRRSGGLRVGPGLTEALSRGVEVLEQQLPLPLLGPFVVALERRNDVAALGREDLLELVGVRLHALSLRRSLGGRGPSWSLQTAATSDASVHSGPSKGR